MYRILIVIMTILSITLFSGYLMDIRMSGLQPYSWKALIALVLAIHFLYGLTSREK